MSYFSVLNNSIYMKICVGLLLVSVIILFAACEKEKSYEAGVVNSTGLLQNDINGDCLPKNVVGVFEQGEELVGTGNYIEVDVDVVTIGSYTVYSDTANGVFFRVTGTFTTTGINTVRLRGNGTPATPGSYNFRIVYDGQECFVPVDFLPAGAGGPAVFTLKGSGTPATCSNNSVTGTYGVGTPLTVGNKVILEVNVATIGTYNVSTTFQGMTFSATGTFLSQGDQPLELTGSGSPTTVGLNTVPVTVGASSCSFPVTVVDAAVYTVDCGSAIPGGEYTEGVALTSANTVVLTVNVATPGAYSITTAAVNGMVFTGSGSLAGGSQIITLTGSGTPVNEGDFDISVPGTPSCTFQIAVEEGAAPTDLVWSFKQGTTVYSGPTSPTTSAASGGFVFIPISGLNTAGDEAFTLMLTRSGAVITLGDYNSTTAPPANNAMFQYSNVSTAASIYSSVFGNGTQLIVKVLVYDTVNGIIEGTFSGKAKNSANLDVDITEGTFKCELL
jgi:hypothetical protein